MFIRYLSTWFIFDVCSTVPFQSLILVFTDHKESGGVGFRLLSMLRLWRLRRVSALFARSKQHTPLLLVLVLVLVLVSTTWKKFSHISRFAFLQTWEGHPVQLLLDAVYKTHISKSSQCLVFKKDDTWRLTFGCFR